MRRTTAIAAMAAVCSGGCRLQQQFSGGSTGSASPASSGGTVDIYSSLPMQGASTAQTRPMVNGIKLALSQADGKAGQWNVEYTSLDDSTAAAGKWDPGQTAANARQAASDPKAVYYIGEFNSGASEVSIPILNQAGIPQVSPANTYVGLTTNLPGSAPGEPQKYYPTGKRTYLRIVPIDSIQAAADLMAMKQAGCTKVAVANDKEAYGAGLAQLLELEKGFYGVTITSNTGIDPTAPNFRSYASTIKGQGADCFFFAGIVSNGAVQITKDVHSAIPKAKVFGGDGVCTDSYTNATKGGVPAAIYPLTRVHGRDPGSGGVSGRQGLPRRVQGQVRRLEPGPIRDLRLRGDEARARHDQEPGGQGQQQGGHAGGPVRDHARSLGARHLRVRQERRHDAEVLRPVQGRNRRRACLRQDAHPDANRSSKTTMGGGARCAPPPHSRE